MSGYMRFIEEAKAQIGPDKKFKNPHQAAIACGIASSQINRYLEEKPEGNIAKFFNFLDTLGIRLVFPDEKLSGFELIPRVKAIAGAGESFVTEDGVAGMYAFRKEFLSRIGVNAKKAAMMYVSGDSMTPLICDGDTLLFDTEDTEPREGYIYVCSFGDALMVKRLQMIPGGWQLCSENQRYSPTPIQGDELQNFRVHGRVRWFGRIV